MENKIVKTLDKDNIRVVIYEGKPNGGYRQLIAQAHVDNVFYGELGAYVSSTESQIHVDNVINELANQLFYEAAS
jgi:hypothetical protein